MLQPIVEKLLQGDDKNKQRGAAEFMAGIIGGESTILMELGNLQPLTNMHRYFLQLRNIGLQIARTSCGNG